MDVTLSTADMWLHVATDALARYVAGGGELGIADQVDDETGRDEIKLIIPVSLADMRLAPAFVALFTEKADPVEAAP